jgi:S-adenosylmethionine hydrolase
MIILFTDFGPGGPYLGQIRAVLHREAPGLAVIDLVSDSPPFDPAAGAYLLAALMPQLAEDAVILAVVDPGVGGPRAPVMVRAGKRWLVGPDNGLMAIAARYCATAQWWDITWRSERTSATFHGRDLFAPVAARLATRQQPAGQLRAEKFQCEWAPDLSRIVYVDLFGNCMTGIRASQLPESAVLCVGEQHIARARTFSDVRPGAPLWYENSNGLAEIAANCARASDLLGLGLGDPVEFE